MLFLFLDNSILLPTGWYWQEKEIQLNWGLVCERLELSQCQQQLSECPGWTLTGASGHLSPPKQLFWLDKSYPAVPFHQIPAKWIRWDLLKGQRVKGYGSVPCISPESHIPGEKKKGKNPDNCWSLMTWCTLHIWTHTAAPPAPYAKDKLPQKPAEFWWVSALLTSRMNRHKPTSSISGGKPLSPRWSLYSSLVFLIPVSPKGDWWKE